MYGKNQVSDKSLLKMVNQQLARTGTGASKITAAVKQGTVILSGNLQYELQRTPVLNAAGRTSGVNRVVDQMRLIPRNPLQARG